MALLNISIGWIEHSNSSGTWSVKISQDLFANTKVVGSRVHHSETDLLEEIFGVNTTTCCENIEYSKLQLCKILFALIGYGESWKRPKFSTYGHTFYHERPTPFFFERLPYVMINSSDAIISSTMHFSVYVSIVHPVFLMLLKLGAVSTSILVESSFRCFHCLPNILLVTVITAETSWCLEQWFVLMTLSRVV